VCLFKCVCDSLSVCVSLCVVCSSITVCVSVSMCLCEFLSLQILAMQPNVLLGNIIRKVVLHCNRRKHMQIQNDSKFKFFISLTKKCVVNTHNAIKCRNIWGVFLCLVEFWVFVTLFCICLHCAYLECVSVFVCIVSFCSKFLNSIKCYLFANIFVLTLSFPPLFLIFPNNTFGCIASICSMFLYLFALWVSFVACFCI